MSDLVQEPPPGDGAGVLVDRLTIGYRRRGQLLTVISDLSFSIAPGEAYGLVGESGCGKSTVAMALMRYLPSNAVIGTGGHIRVLGHDLRTVSGEELRRLRGDRISMVYQDPGTALNPSLRVGRQIAEIFQHHRRLGKAAAEDATLTMLDRVRIADPARVARRYPHELSGGQQQRVMIAMALCTNPGVLILDEPTTGLDVTVEAEILDLVGALRRDYRAAILFISHNLAVVARICERVGVLYAGRLVEEGTSAEVLSAPRHPYTLGLLRSMPTTGLSKDSTRLSPIPGALPALGTDLAGCGYAPRCPLAQDRCRSEAPPLLAVGGTHASRCWFYSDVDSIPREPAPAEAALAGTARCAHPAEPVLTVDRLVKTYPSPRGDVVAVADVSFHINRGEVFGLVGESGSGKSSVAKCVVGLQTPTSGEIRLMGWPAHQAGRAGRREMRRLVQMVFQNPDAALNPQRSVGRTIGLSLTLLSGVSDRDERRDALERLAASVKLLPQHLAVKPTHLSGGLKQRASIAGAIAGDPALVVCDEPVSAVDVSVQAAILNTLVDLLALKQMSYLFISHDLAVVRYVSDRIGVMYLGKLVEIGPAERVFRPPHHPYTEALASAIPEINRTEERGRIRLEGTPPSPVDPPSGCRFHTRCPRFLGEICRREEPPWQTPVEGHAYQCHIPPADLAGLQSGGSGQ